MGKETLTIIKADISREVIAKIHPKHLKLGKMEFKATVEVDSSAATELDTDARFVARLYDDATKKYKDCVIVSARRIQQADDLSGVLKLTDQELEQEADPGRPTVYVPFPILEELAARGDRTAGRALAAIDRWLEARGSPRLCSVATDPRPTAGPTASAQPVA